MNEEIYKLKPERVWYYFGEILKIPRPSKKEEKIAAYIVEFGKKQKLETLRDEIGNVLIRKEATPGNEKMVPVILQSHIDMVCEKNEDTVHDFDKDPIRAYVEDGWVTAKGTTLGADDGIGVATQLAILESNDIEHGPIECLFTVDEETGLTGAFGLQPGFLKGKILLNLDSEDEGELFIGCAGGKDTLAEIPVNWIDAPQNHKAYKIKISGLKGGHSGDDINKERGNANKLLNRILWDANNDLFINIAHFDGGNLRNAIAREASAIIMVPEHNKEKIKKLVSEYNQHFKTEFNVSDPGVEASIEDANHPEKVMDIITQNALINSIYACPHGVIAMSQDIKDFVETSTNLASVKTQENSILITTSQRSSVNSSKENICNMVASVFHLANASVKHTDGYPGWNPNPHSKIVEITAQAYKDLFKTKPKVLAIHAGLECGLIGDKYPEMDMISYGPTLRGVHSPDEKIDIETVRKFWILTLEVLKRIPQEV